MAGITSLSDMKRTATQAALEEINKKVQEYSRGSFVRDERYWQPVVDKANNGGAAIRFLPPPVNEDIPFVRKWSHAFKDPRTNLWYIENCLTTLKQTDPVAELNSKLWGGGKKCIPANEEQVKRQKRKLGFVSNILVLAHPARPEDEGKNFLYEYGKTIFDQLNEQMNPPEDEIKKEPMWEAYNPFDFWSGATFRLRVRNKDGFRSYDKSSFDARSPLFDDDAKLEELWRKEYSLTAEVAADKFKSYEELKKKLDRVLGLTGDSAPAPRREDRADEAPGPSEEKGTELGAFFQKLASRQHDEDEIPF